MQVWVNLDTGGECLRKHREKESREHLPMHLLIFEKRYSADACADAITLGSILL